MTPWDLVGAILCEAKLASDRVQVVQWPRTQTPELGVPSLPCGAIGCRTNSRAGSAACPPDWEADMDNGAYGKYRRENPIIHESLSTFDNILLLPERLSTEEIVTFSIFGLLALYAVVMLVFKLLRGKQKNASADEKTPDADERK